MAEVAVAEFPSTVEEALASAEDNILDIQAPMNYPATFRCTVTIGASGIQFSQSGVVVAIHINRAVGESVDMTVYGNKQIHFLADAQNDAFEIEQIR